MNLSNQEGGHNMASMELRASVFEKLNHLLDNDEAMEQLDNYLLRLKKKMTKATKIDPPLAPYTIGELNERIDKAEIEIEAGEVLTCAQANAEVRKALSWLR